MTIPATAAQKSSNELAEERTDLAAMRTAMAADRSLMAWIRTGLSMISFGFTIYKLLQGLQAGGALLPRPDSPRNIGLFLTGLGTVSIVIGTIEHWQAIKGLHQHAQQKLLRPAFALAVIMSVLGVFLFVGIISKAL